jgi:hypothetical protein
MRAVRPDIVSNGVPSLQIRSVGSHSTSERKEEGKKERVGKVIGCVNIYSILNPDAVLVLEYIPLLKDGISFSGTLDGCLVFTLCNNFSSQCSVLLLNI